MNVDEPYEIKPAGPIPRDLSDIETGRLEELQRAYVRRLKLKEDHETIAKSQAVGYELGMRIVLSEIRKDLAKFGS